MKKSYTVVIEWADGNYSGYVPDLPGCVAMGDSPDEVRRKLEAGATIYVSELRKSGASVPEPISAAGQIDVEVA